MSLLAPFLLVTASPPGCPACSVKTGQALSGASSSGSCCGAALAAARPPARRVPAAARIPAVDAPLQPHQPPALPLVPPCLPLAPCSPCRPNSPPRPAASAPAQRLNRSRPGPRCSSLPPQQPAPTCCPSPTWTRFPSCRTACPPSPLRSRLRRVLRGVGAGESGQSSRQQAAGSREQAAGSGAAPCQGPPARRMPRPALHAEGGAARRPAAARADPTHVHRCPPRAARACRR